jgi:hypothetical protein
MTIMNKNENILHRLLGKAFLYHYSTDNVLDVVDPVHDSNLDVADPK